MRSCIYVRAYRKDKSHNRTGIERQVEFCRELGRQHNLIIEDRHVFRDMDHSGSWAPARWAFEEDENVRPALSAMLDAIEDGRISSVVVFRADRLGTSSDVLEGLLEFFNTHGIDLIVSPEAVQPRDDPADSFAVSMLKPRMIYGSAEDREKLEKLRTRKVDELVRLQAKVERLQDEIADLT